MVVMNRRVNYPMKVYFSRDNRAQSTIEFTLAFVTAILFLVLTCNLFVWLNHSLVQRQRDYEQSRVTAATSPDRGGEPGKLDFYTPKTMNLFVSGGYN